MDNVTVRCKRPWTSFLVTTNGDCYHCCYQKQPIGNLVDSEFPDVWNGQAAQEIRSDFLNGKIPRACEPGIGNCPELGRK